ncbi:MAG: flagellar hook capping protein [Anaerolineae bacterium]|nr:flagellar hook capping protein [Anaerolineae bacterium]
MSNDIWGLMVGTRNVTAATTANAQRTQDPAALGKEAFMQLLLMQMQNQDPLSPMEGQDFFQQLAQLSLLEQMWAMNDNLNAMMGQQQLLQAGSLIGKTVEATKENGIQITGEVKGVRVLDGEVFLDVDGDSISLSQVTAVREQ